MSIEAQLKYLTGYSPSIQQQAQRLVDSNTLEKYLLTRYPSCHQLTTDRALYQYAQGLKSQYIKKSAPVTKVVYDDKIQLIKHALGTHSFVNRVQGSKIKAKNEIRIASLFKRAPEAFLSMIVAHELAHLKEKDHNKAFYQLCQHIEPNYFQLELDCRLYLTQIETIGAIY